MAQLTKPSGFMGVHFTALRIIVSKCYWPERVRARWAGRVHWRFANSGSPAARYASWRKRYRDAVEVVDTKNPAEAFRHAVRQALTFEFRNNQIGDAEIESAVQQICYRAADLSYLLDQSNQKLSDYSQELRGEDEAESDVPPEV